MQFEFIVLVYIFLLFIMSIKFSELKKNYLLKTSKYLRDYCIEICEKKSLLGICIFMISNNVGKFFSR